MENPSNSSLKYRPEIDGLRAVAVLAVVLFHAGFKPFQGGFVGVDVFFVISGYLITSIILKEKIEGNFSLLRFYQRRAKRILPALFFVVFLITPFAFFWMMPEQFKTFSQSLLFLVLFSSNIFFWKKTGYFGRNPEENPLLHTWSLSLEEQFYFLFPLMLIIFWRLGVRRTFYLILLLFGISIGLCGYFTSSKALASFFLLPTRAWEILMGSILAFLVKQNSFVFQRNKAVSEFSSFCGLILILFAIYFFDSSLAFPGFYALVPTFGAALIILFAQKNSLVGKLLSLKPIVLIGMMSYSIYLWHHPLFSLAKVYFMKPVTLEMRLVLIAATLLLAFFTWNRVEKPFRSTTTFNRRRTFQLSFIASLAALVLGLAGTVTNGFEKNFQRRMSAEQASVYSELQEAIGSGGYETMYDDSMCKFWTKSIDSDFMERYRKCSELFKESILVIGDSHAMDFFNAIAQNTSYPFVVSISMVACRAADLTSSCQYSKLLEVLAKNELRIKYIFYTQSSFYFRDGIKKPVNLDHLKRTQSYLNTLAEKHKVFWFGPQPELEMDLRLINPLRLVFNPSINNHAFWEDEFLKTSNQDHVFTFVSKIELMNFQNSHDFYQDRKFTFSDADHWSSYGEAVFGKRIVNNLVRKFQTESRSAQTINMNF